MKYPTHIILLVVLVIGVLVALSFMNKDDRPRDENQPSYAVTLSATTDKDSYTSGDSVTLNVDLRNTGDIPTCLSNTTQGNITFVSFTRDGQEVASRTVEVDALESVALMTQADLREVAPGDTVTIPLQSSYDPGLEAQALHTSKATGIYATATFYNIQEPGNYEIQLAYTYPGDIPDSCQAVFEDQSNTTTVSFTIN